MNCNWITPVVTNASSRVGHVVLFCLHMCVQLRPVIKDDSMLQAVFKVCLKYTSTQKQGSMWPGENVSVVLPQRTNSLWDTRLKKNVDSRGRSEGRVCCVGTICRPVSDTSLASGPCDCGKYLI